jgi:hypothetical protein
LNVLLIYWCRAGKEITLGKGANVIGPSHCGVRGRRSVGSYNDAVAGFGQNCVAGFSLLYTACADREHAKAERHCCRNEKHARGGFGRGRLIDRAEQERRGFRFLPFAALGPFAPLLAFGLGRTASSRGPPARRRCWAAQRGHRGRLRRRSSLQRRRRRAASWTGLPT